MAPAHHLICLSASERKQSVTMEGHYSAQRGGQDATRRVEDKAVDRQDGTTINSYSVGQPQLTQSNLAIVVTQSRHISRPQS